MDLIGVGERLAHMQFNPKKLPLALDVKIPRCSDIFGQDGDV